MRERSMPLVSVIIPVYNDPQRLKTCLQALEMQTYPKDSYEVIVVDNGSDENIEPIVAQFPQADATYEARSGSYAARNKGIAFAQGEILAFTDSDCIPAPDWIERGVAHLQQVPNCGIVGGRLEPLFQQPNHPTAVELYEVIMYYCQKRFVEVMNFSVTANLFTFRRIVEHVGAFEATLKSSGDREWGQRVASFGYHLVYADEVCVAHPARSTFRQLQQKERRIVGGIEGLASTRQHLHSPWWHMVWHGDFLPPVLSVARFGKTQHIRKSVQIQVIALWCAMKFIGLGEQLRLKLGARSVR